MTDSKSFLSDFQPSVEPQVTFGDNGTRSTEGYGAFLHCLVKFYKILYVNGLTHNLISVSQLCDVDYKVLFDKYQGTIFNINGEVVSITPRKKGVYFVDLKGAPTERDTCFYSKENDETN